MEDNFNYEQKPLEGLNREEGRIRDLQNKGYNLSYLKPEGISFAEEIDRQNVETPIQESIGYEGVNKSVFDRGITSIEQLNNLDNARGELQPWYAQLGAGTAKGTVLAGTTLLNTLVAIPLGLVGAAIKGDSSYIWNNGISRSLKAINDASEEVLPNYYTDEERNGDWTDHIFSANFLGDKLIKNLGFVVGSTYAGMGIANVLKLSRIPQFVGSALKSVNAPSVLTSTVASTMTGIGESSMEAINNSKQAFEEGKQVLHGNHLRNLVKISEEYSGTGELLEQLTNEENKRYNEALSKLNEDRIKMGNANFLMNLPLTTGSNIFQFGRLYSRGFKTAKRAAKVLGRAGKYTTPTGSRVARVAKGFADPITEGIQEISQEAVNRIARDYYETDMANFYKSKIDPEAEEETLSWIKSFAKGVNETINDGSSWEQFTIGAITGALGAPRFRSIRSESGSLRSPVTLEGGSLGRYGEYKEEADRENKIVNYLNDRVNSPEFLNYYQGFIRHNKYQNDMNRALDEGSEFDYKNAEYGQLISDISMFDNAGKIGDLTSLISSAYDTSDANLQAIAESTTSTTIGPNGKKIKIGLFVDENGNPLYSTPKGKQLMIDKLTQSRDEILNTVNEYARIKNDIDIRSGQVLTDDQLEELTYLKSQIGNWDSRASQLADEIKPIISSVNGTLAQLSNLYGSIKSEEGKRYAGLSDLYNKADSNERILDKNREVLSYITGLDNNVLSKFLASNPDIREGIKSIVNDPSSGITVDDAQDFSKKVDDIGRLVDATKKFDIKLREYLENPEKLQDTINKSRETVAKEEENRRSESLKSSLSSATNLEEFRSILGSTDDLSTRDKVIRDLENEGNNIAKDYRDTETYRERLEREILSTEEDPTIRDNALNILREAYNGAQNLQQLSNPDYIQSQEIISNEELTPEENELKYQEAQYALLRAMNKVASDSSFAREFSSPISIEGVKPSSKNTTINSSVEDTRETTGYSETSTVPTININSQSESTTDIPVSNITQEELYKENSEILSNELPESSNKINYYRPSIPELDIEASKNGDFRPFNVVVSERDSRLNFDRLYNYLRDNGAFNYINEGNLSRGDELGFMIDPEFNDSTIFIVDTRNNQIVGSLDESKYSIDRYEGLAELEDKIRSEYINRPNREGRFIATPTTRVSRIMIGRIPYGRTERDLIDIPNVSSGGRGPIFGIIKNGTLSTNGKLSDSSIIKPVDINNKEGRMYLLIPNANNTYSPAAVRVKHFNRQEFNPEDINVKSTQIYKNIEKSIDDLSVATNPEEVVEAMKSLKNSLYIGDVNVMWYDSKRSSGIRINKKVRDDSGNIVKENFNGRLVDKEETHFITYTENWDPNTIYEIGEDNKIKTTPDLKEYTEIAKEITSVLLDLNLPIQVNLGMLNTPGYNNLLLNSRVLTSNIEDARVLSSWFITDYFDVEGNLHRSTSPSFSSPSVGRKIETPIGGEEGVINGNRVTINNTKYGVDLARKIIYDSNNQVILPDNSELIFDIAWADSNFGNSTVGSLMIDNKVLTPSGRVLDRTTLSYLDSKEANKIKELIKAKQRIEKDTTKIIDHIAENQKKVDRTKIDGDYYYILEDDGQYHKYQKVDNRLGHTVQLTEKQDNALNNIRLELSKYSGNIPQYNRYLRNIGKYYSVDLSPFEGTTTIDNRNIVVSTIKDKMLGFATIDSTINNVVRSFFTSNEVPIRPSNISEVSFKELINSITEVRSDLEDRGERFLSNNVVLFQKYEDGTRIAGEADIISVDSDGNFRIYSIGINKKGTNFSDRNKEYYTLQLSAYKNLFESQYHTPISDITVIPFTLNHLGGIINKVTIGEGIRMEYNPAIIVPISGVINPIIQDNSAENSSSTTLSGAAITIQAELSIEESDPEFEEDLVLRKVGNNDRNIWNKEKELKWLDRVLPQLSKEDRVRVTKGLISVANRGTYAWGQLNNGIITLSDIAAEGTTYHEAYHVVFNLLLDTTEREILLEEARELYGDKSDIELEENMAEGFREYVMNQEDRGLGRKILNFFKDLYTKVVNWNRVRPSLINYYRRINEGKYSSVEIPVPTTNRLEDATMQENKHDTFNSIDTEIQEALLNKGWTQEKFNSISQQERDQAIKCFNL